MASMASSMASGIYGIYGVLCVLSATHLWRGVCIVVCGIFYGVLCVLSSLRSVLCAMWSVVCALLMVAGGSYGQDHVLTQQICKMLKYAQEL